MITMFLKVDQKSHTYIVHSQSFSNNCYYYNNTLLVQFPLLLDSMCYKEIKNKNKVFRSEYFSCVQVLMATTGTFGWHYCRAFSRGTMLVLIWGSLLQAVLQFVHGAAQARLTIHFQYIFDCTTYIFALNFPVTGWIAESWLGRYRTIILGLLLTTASVLTVQVAFVMSLFDWTPVPSFALDLLSLVFGSFGLGSLYTSILPFALDQMIGASAEDLSAIVQWYCWGLTFAQLTSNFLQFIPFPLQLQRLDFFALLLLMFSSVGLSASLIMDCLCHKWIDTHKKTGNPIKLIFQVLNYARKNTYPRLRSAFTYIDEEQPSRLDFGKHKFGGPFTEEEVEDVKTVFRLALLSVSIYGPAHFCMIIHMSLMVLKSEENYHYITGNIIQVIYVVAIPVYRFMVYPWIRKYVPSLVKTMGAGLFICLVSTVISLAVESFQHFHSNASHCIFDNSVAVGTLPTPLHWVLITKIVAGLGHLLVFLSFFEFMMAQTPNRMRGIMMGLTSALFAFGEMGLYALIVIFHIATYGGCVFYYYLVLSLLMLLILAVYVVLAKRYKLRERDKHINIHAIVEEHYERYFDQEEEYMREANERNISVADIHTNAH